jgi:macrolide-specific efflux system membrane fusion protein
MNKRIVLILVGCAIGLGVYLTLCDRDTAGDAGEGPKIIGEASVTRGTIQRTIAATGNVQPQNRLEVRPSLAGRLEEILVKEGDHVTAGQTVAWMSSTERTSLLDAARVRGEQDMAYWEKVYKPAPLIAPIAGEIIVRRVEPGQSVGPSEAVVVIADRLIVKAQVDETDIGKITTGRVVVVTLDAYQAQKVTGVVDHIAYESRTVNNVTIYEVDVALADVPAFFRSGMSATVEIVEESHENALLLPVSAVQQGAGGASVYVKGGDGVPMKVEVTVGFSDRENTEILTGLTEGQAVAKVLPDFGGVQQTDKKNPFLPFGGTGRPSGGGAGRGAGGHGR